MNILLVYPQYPRTTYWSFSRTQDYIGTRASMPPLGLVTVAALLPADCDLRLVDMNIEPLLDEQIAWADLVMTSTMVVQSESLASVIRRANRLGVPVAAGGPHPSIMPGEIEGADHVIVGEAERILAGFMEDFRNGRAAPVYRAPDYPEVTETPAPRFDLLDLSAYACMPVQYSRGCPYSCEFCDIWRLYGRRPRTKDTGQFLEELDSLHGLGWRGSVFVVDDNFIGNPARVREFLVEVRDWQRSRGYPFGFLTEATMNLAEDPVLLERMRDAGFNFVFLGIETPSVESLKGTNKHLNARMDMLRGIRTIQEHGIEVSGGFIVGFDDDREDIFDRQARFIEEAAIPVAMAGILIAMPGTDLYDRLEREGRLLDDSEGNNTHQFRANFQPRMPAEELSAGYRRLVGRLYDPGLRNYFRRCRTLLRRLGRNPLYSRKPKWQETLAFFRSLRAVPLRPYGRQYLWFLLWSLLFQRDKFAEAVRLGITGFHFHAITQNALACSDLHARADRCERTLGNRLERLAEMEREGGSRSTPLMRRIVHERKRMLRYLKGRIRKLDPDFRSSGMSAYQRLIEGVDSLLSRKLPASKRPLASGPELLEEIQAFYRREAEAFHVRYRDMRERANRGLEDLESGLRDLYRDRKRKLREARRRIRLLPREYRMLGRREYQAFRRRLDEFLLTEAPAPA